MVPYDLHRLRLLRELEQRGTLGAVASALGYSPSAISQQLAVLEKEAGVDLFEKAGRGVRLTDAGRVLARHAATILAAAEAAHADLSSLSGDVRGTVRAAGLQSATRHILIPALASLRRGYPAVRVEISEIELEQALPELMLGSLDVVISDDYDGQPRPRPTSLRFALLHEEPLKLVLPPEHPRARHGGPVVIAALGDDVWVASASGTGHHALVVNTCRSLGGFEPDLRHRSNDADVQLDLVRTAGVVALMPPLTLPVGDPTLAIRDIVGSTINRRLMILTREIPPTPALETFLAAVAAQLPTDPNATDPRIQPLA